MANHLVVPAKLHRIAEECGYGIEYRPMKRVRGWPTESAKPYSLYFKDGSHLASFATIEALEKNLRARAGC